MCPRDLQLTVRVVEPELDLDPTALQHYGHATGHLDPATANSNRPKRIYPTAPGPAAINPELDNQEDERHGAIVDIDLTDLGSMIKSTLYATAGSRLYEHGG